MSVQFAVQLSRALPLMSVSGRRLRRRESVFRFASTILAVSSSRCRFFVNHFFLAIASLVGSAALACPPARPSSLRRVFRPVPLIGARARARLGFLRDAPPSLYLGEGAKLSRGPLSRSRLLERRAGAAVPLAPTSLPLFFGGRLTTFRADGRTPRAATKSPNAKTASIVALSSKTEFYSEVRRTVRIGPVCRAPPTAAPNARAAQSNLGHSFDAAGAPHPECLQKDPAKLLRSALSHAASTPLQVLSNHRAANVRHSPTTEPGDSTLSSTQFLQQEHARYTVLHTALPARRMRDRLNLERPRVDKGTRKCRNLLAARRPTHAPTLRDGRRRGKRKTAVWEGLHIFCPTTAWPTSASPTLGATRRLNLPPNPNA